MLGDIDQPFLIDLVGSELAIDEVIPDRGTGLPIATLAFRDHRLQTSNLAQPPYPPLADLVPQIVEVIREHPVPTLGVIGVEFLQHLDEVCFLDLTR